jgi:tetratricopeptide (TPR) repeat protein
MYPVQKSISILIIFIIFSPSSLIALEASEYPIIANVSLPIKEFVNRSEILRRIAEIYHNGKNVILLTGISGVGKSQVAKKYSYLHSHEYHIIWFFDCERNLEYQFQTLAKLINHNICNKFGKCTVMESPKESISSVKKFLEENDSSWLIVFDNYNSSNELDLQHYMPNASANSNKHILVTSQKKQFWAENIVVTNFETQYSLELLSKYLVDNSSDDLTKLASNLGNYPIMLVNVGRYLKENNYISIQDVIRLNKAQTSKVTDLVAMDQNGYQGFFKKLVQNIKTNPETFRLLLYCLILDNHNLSKNLLYLFYKDPLSDVEYDSFLLALSYLNNNSLIEHTEHTTKTHEDSYFEMHDFIKKSMLEQIEKEVIRENLKDLVIKINKWFPQDIPSIDKSLVLYPNLVTNLEETFNLLDRYDISWEDKLEFKENLLCVYINYSLYDNIEELILWMDQNIPLHFEAKNLKQRKLVSEYYIYRSYYYNIVKKDIDSAIRDANKAIHLSEGLAKEESLKYMAYSMLVQIRLFHGDLIGAKKDLNEVKKVLNGALNKGLYYNLQSEIYREEGNYDKALAEVDNSIKNNAEVFGNSPFTIDAYLLKADSLCRKEKYKEAYQVINAIDKELLASLDDNYEIKPLLLIIQSRINLGLGNVQLAKEEIKKSIDVLEKVDGIKQANYNLSLNRELAFALTIESDIYYSQHIFNMAITGYKTAYSIYKNIYKTMEVDHVSDLLFKLAKTSLMLGNKFDFNLYKLQHEEYFGINHRRTKILYKLEIDS